MQWFVHVFQQYPELAIFLTTALGFAIGMGQKNFNTGVISIGIVSPLRVL